MAKVRVKPQGLLTEGLNYVGAIDGTKRRQIEALLNQPNRRVRTRTHYDVGGEEP